MLIADQLMTVLLELLAVSLILYVQIAHQPVLLCQFQLSLYSLIDNHVINLLKYYQRSIQASTSAYGADRTKALEYFINQIKLTQV